MKMLWRQPLYKTITRHMGYADKSDHLTNSYSISRSTRKWMKNFFNLLDLSILNNFILLIFWIILPHLNFRLVFVRDLIQDGGGTNPIWHKTYWTLAMPSEWRQIRCSMCSVEKKEVQIKLKSSKHKLGLCVYLWFRVYHTELHSF